jgi:hypothetical protein
MTLLETVGLMNSKWQTQPSEYREVKLKEKNFGGQN